MKKVLVAMVSLALLGSVAVVQAADEQKQEMPMTNHHMMKDGGMGMMNCPMVKSDDGKGQMGCQMQGKMGGQAGGMMKHHKMMQAMMQMMKDSMTIQKKMITGATPEEKMKMEKDLSAMIEKMDKMMSSCQSMMMDMQKPASADQKNEESMPMEHKH